MRFQHVKLNRFLGALVGAFLIVVGLYPQLDLRQTRGAIDYQGVYAYNDLDETAYAAYLQALIDGRPRRNNPFTGVDDEPGKPMPESLFSIQFLAPYAAAIPARIFGATASTALIWISALAALAAALSIYWLALSLTENAFFAAATTLVVLCCGVLMIGEGAFGEMWYGAAAYPYFPFLRRYVPAIPFPLFWLFCLAVWRVLTKEQLKIRMASALLAAALFAALVYSYFYLWTTAAAWLACLGLVWVVFRPLDWRRDVRALIVLSVFALLALAPYGWLLARRDAGMDDVQLLIYTRAPDLLRRPEILSFMSLFLIFVFVWRGAISLRDKLILLIISLALVPIAVFNQQILTGRVLQPIHYEVFIVNYVALFALCLTLFVVWRGRAPGLPAFSRPLLAITMILAGVWGLIEARYTTAVISHANVLRDDAKPISDRLCELGRGELFDGDNNRARVLPLDLLQGDDLPAFAPQSVLWARHQHVFAGESIADNKTRFYHFLYFSGFDGNALAAQLRANNVVVVISLFGWDRLTGRLSSQAKPLTENEIQTEAQNFDDFCRNFDLPQAARWQLNYVVVQAENDFDFSVLDRWYERSPGERVRNHILYQVKLKR